MLSGFGRIASLVVCLGFVLASSARAQFDAILKLGDQFNGTVLSNIDEDALLFEAMGGTKLTVTVKGEKNFKPTLRLFQADTGGEIVPGNFLSGLGSKTVKLKNYPLPATATYVLVVAGFEGQTGKYEVTTSGKLDASLTSFSGLTFLASGETAVFGLSAISNTKVTVVAKPKSGSFGAIAEITQFDGPEGPIDLDPFLKTKGATVTANKVPIGKTGSYFVTVRNDGFAGELQVSISLAVPKGKSEKKEAKEPKTPGGLTGTLTVPPILAIPEIAGPNDTVATAQYCGTIGPGALVRVQGSITGSTDFDAYRIEVGQPMSLQLTLLHDYFGDDFDLGVFSVASGTYLSPTLETANEPEMGVVSLPSAGAYLLVVWPYAGIGNYILTATGTTTTSAASVPTLDGEARDRPAAVRPNALMEFDADFVPGEFIVKLRDSQADRRAFAASRGLDVRLESPSGYFVVTPRNAPQGDAEQRRFTVFEKERMRLEAEVEVAELNYRMHAFAIPNDPLFSYQWHYGSMKLPQAWDVTKGSQNIIVAVLDTGIVAHPDLVTRNSGTGYDFISSPQSGLDNNGIDPDPTDPGDLALQGGKSTWHGSHVAGTIGAATNNGYGVSGVDWFCRIMPMRVLGYGGGATYDIAEALRYTARLPNVSGAMPPQRANVANMSLGGGPPNQTMQDAVFAARAQGVTVIAAAGNDATSNWSYPASYNGVISVSATDPLNNLASYSNYGTMIDVTAPGGETQVDYTQDGYGDGVLSTIVDEDQGQYAFDFSQGTSMACPHVAGVAALLLSVNPNLSPDQVEALLESTAIDLAPAGPDTFFGAGLVDAFAAVKAAAQTSAPQLTPSTQLLDFGGVTSQLGFTIANTGNGTLAWTASDTENQGGNWLSLSSGGGNATPASPSQLTATVNRGGLAAGAYTATIFLASNGGQAQIQVMMTVAAPPPQPTLSVSTNALDFGSSLTQLTFSVSNAGSGSLNFTAADAENPAINWLSLSNAGTTLNGGQSISITATANRGILAPGAYSATIQINSNGGNVVIQVSLSVAPPTSPNLSLSAQALDFSTNASQYSVSVANTGGGTLTFGATDVELNGIGWLSVTPGNGTAPANLLVTVNRNGLSAGHYTGKVDVSSNGGNKSITISMDVSTVVATPIPIGTVYVVAVNPQSFFTEANALLGSGGGTWLMNPMPIGGYFVFAGPDLDKDGYLCGPGEPCGGYPTLVDPALAIVLPGLLTSFVSFSINTDASLPAGTAAWLGLPEKGLPIQP
jgi:serine protease